MRERGIVCACPETQTHTLEIAVFRGHLLGGGITATLEYVSDCYGWDNVV
jgi:hypothetical protein